jgi:fructose-1,6-bisphosphatase/inositol monophosphatase family enzyme
LLYGAAQGVGAFYNHQSVAPSTKPGLADAFVYTYLPTHKLPEKETRKIWQTLHRLSHQAYRVRGIAQESTALCWVGSGQIEAMVHLGGQPKWHDIVPGLFFAQTAGAITSDAKGKPLINHRLDQGFIVANNKKVHEQILKAVNSG